MNLGPSLKCIFLLLMSFLLYSECSAQLHPPHFIVYPPGTGCGIINPLLSIVSNSPACYHSLDTIQLKSDILVDTIYINFGDGKDTIICNPTALVFNVAHLYNFTPSDSCPPAFLEGQPALVCPIEAYFFKKCTGSYSYATNSTGISFRFKPRVRFLEDYRTNYVPGQGILLKCNTDCIQLSMTNCCTNTYWNTDSTDYQWSYGDGTSDDVVPNTPDDFFENPLHCYTQPSSNPAYYTLKLTASNTCGTSSDWVKVYIEEISTVQISSGPYCTGSAVHLQIGAQGATGNPLGDPGYSTTVYPLGTPAANITGGSTANPAITFYEPGTYTITAGYGSCNQDTQITIDQGVNMTQTLVHDSCFTGHNQLNLSSHYSSTGTTQSNHFVVLDSGVVAPVFNNTSNSIPSSSISLPQPGTYYIFDTSVTTCNTVVYRDTFRILPLTISALPNDTSVCLQSLYILPTFPGTTIQLDGVVLSSDSFFVTDLRPYLFVYTPACGNSDTFKITGKGTRATALDTSFCSSPGIISLIGLPGGGTFSGSFVLDAGGHFDGNAAGAGTHPYLYSYTDVLNCTYVDTAAVHIFSAALVNYSLTDTVCAGTQAIFADNGTGKTDSVNFGDGTGVLTGDTIAHDYASSGLQHVSIQIADSNNCLYRFLDSVLVLPLPISSFAIPTAICDDGIITPLLTTPLVAQDTYQWIFGTDTFATAPNLTIRDTSYNIIDDTVNLIVTSPQCGSKVQNQIVMALPQTKADFGLFYQANCSPMKVGFVNNARGDSLSYTWYMNGIEFSHDSALVDRWLTADSTDSTYRFKLVVCSSSCGCDSSFDSVTVHPVNFAVCFLPDSFVVCEKQPLSFHDCGRAYCDLTYKFGDGADSITRSGTPVSHAYQQADTFKVWLVMTCNCMTDSVSQTVIVKPSPQVTPDILTSACTANAAAFHAVTVSGNPVAYTWYFGDGTYSYFQNPTHVYYGAGNYDGWLSAIGDDFCASDTSPFALPVVQSPSSSFARDTAVCQRSPLEIKVDSLTPNATYLWQVTRTTDSVLVTSSIGSFYFNTADTGTFLVSLKAFNNSNPLCNSISGNMQVVVMTAPVANFTVSPPTRAKVFTAFEFDNFSSNATSYWWNFGNGDSVYTKNPSYVYTVPGVYNVTLTAVNDLCQDTASESLTVDAVGKLFIPNVISPNGDGNNDCFRIFSNVAAINGLEVKIFDRIGELVFQSEDINFKWDGTFKNKLVEEGVFAYELEVHIVDEPGPRFYKGSVTVLR